MITFDEFGDLSDYDDETIECANKAFFLCEEEEDYAAAEPFLKFAAMRRYSYSMACYGYLLIHSQNRSMEEVLYGCDLLMVAAIRQNEDACEYFKTVDKNVVAKIVALLQKIEKKTFLFWIRGETIDDEKDKSTVAEAKMLLYRWIKSK